MQPHIKSVAGHGSLLNLEASLAHMHDTVVASIPNVSEVSMGFVPGKLTINADFRKMEHAQTAMELVRCGAIPALKGCGVGVGTPPPGRIRNRVVITPGAAN